MNDKFLLLPNVTVTDPNLIYTNQMRSRLEPANSKNTFTNRRKFKAESKRLLKWSTKPGTLRLIAP